MQTFSGILLVAILFSVVALATQFWRTTANLDESRRTVEGYLTLIEGLYAYRADNVTRWPTTFLDLTPHLPALNVDTIDPMQASANGEGRRYILAISAGYVTLSTTVSTEAHARSVVREFGANGTYASTPDGFMISVVVPAPGGIALMQQTLLTDGTNKMQRPLWMHSTVSTGSACNGTGMALDFNGNLMRCTSGTWQSY